MSGRFGKLRDKYAWTLFYFSCSPSLCYCNFARNIFLTAFPDLFDFSLIRHPIFVVFAAKGAKIHVRGGPGGHDPGDIDSSSPMPPALNFSEELASKPGSGARATRAGGGGGVREHHGQIRGKVPPKPGVVSV